MKVKVNYYRTPWRQWKAISYDPQNQYILKNHYFLSDISTGKKKEGTIGHIRSRGPGYPRPILLPLYTLYYCTWWGQKWSFNHCFQPICTKEGSQEILYDSFFCLVYLIFELTYGTVTQQLQCKMVLLYLPSVKCRLLTSDYQQFFFLQRNKNQQAPRELWSIFCSSISIIKGGKMYHL